MSKILGLGEEKGRVGRKKSMVRGLALGFFSPLRDIRETVMER